jgi:hypothetical protein
MPNKNDDLDHDADQLDDTAGVSFRDYPSSALVVFAALGSGLAWMLYKWLGQKKPAQPGAPGDVKSPAEGDSSPSGHKR